MLIIILFSIFFFFFFFLIQRGETGWTQQNGMPYPGRQQMTSATTGADVAQDSFFAFGSDSFPTFPTHHGYNANVNHPNFWQNEVYSHLSSLSSLLSLLSYHAKLTLLLCFK